MTVLTTIAKAGPYAGAGTTGPFTVPFRFLDAAHLRVIRSVGNVETVLVLGTDYTVSGVGATSGTVTLVAPLPVGQTLTVVRSVPATQEADYVPGDSFPAESHEQALDKLTMITQQLQEEVRRSAKLPASSPSDADALSVALLRVDANSSNINAVNANSANINAAVANSANINTVAGSIGNVNTVGGNIASVNTVATNIAAIIDAPNQASAAAASQTAAGNSATNAAASATTAGNAATSATASQTAAGNSAAAALASQAAAATSATNAATSATNAAASAASATASQTAAANSATTASNAATSATASQTAAANSATTAGNAATSATASQTAAAGSATTAGNAATSATASQTAAGNSAAAALASQAAAATSATNAATSATNAAASAASVNAANLVQVTGDQTIGGTKTFTGNVGIGTSSPAHRLHIAGNTLVPLGHSYHCFTEDYGMGTPDFLGLQVFTGSGDTIRFGTRSSGTFTERAIIDSAGNFIVTGNITIGGQFIGNGAGLTGVPASAIAGALNASGSAPIYACRAWVNFNGVGTVFIRASGNVSSITDNGVGDYTVNFTTAMPDANYAVVGIGGLLGAGGRSDSSIKLRDEIEVPTTAGVRIAHVGASYTDADRISVAIFR